MKLQIKSLGIVGSRLLTQQVHIDSRGAFEIFWDQASLANTDLLFRPSNAHHSYNAKAETNRAFHFQRPPYGQSKLVSCVTGRVWDFILDLRPESPTFRQWEHVELTPVSGKSVYIPSGCAHGFATLEDNTTLAYLIEGDFRPESSAAVRWNDPELGIDWPVRNPILSDKDQHAMDLDSYLRSLC